MTLLRDIIDAEPSSYEEVAKKKGKESTRSIRMMSSIWIYKIQHPGDDNIMGYNEIFVAQGFSRKEGIDYEEIFAATGS